MAAKIEKLNISEVIAFISKFCYKLAKNRISKAYTFYLFILLKWLNKNIDLSKFNFNIFSIILKMDTIDNELSNILVIYLL